MKKIMLFSCAFLLVAGSAFAGGTEFTSSGGSGSGVLQGFKASKQVILACDSAAATYGVAADHMSGTRAFASVSGDPLLYFVEKTTTEIGTNVASAKCTGSDSGMISSGWTAL